VPKNGLNRLVIHAESMEVRSEPATEGMPPTPSGAVGRENWFDVSLGERIEVKGHTVPRPLEDKPSGRISASRAKLGEDVLKSRDDRYGGAAAAGLRRLNLFSPDGALDVEFAVVLRR